MTEYASADKLLADLGESAHIECGRETSIELARAVRRRFATRRCAFALEADAGCPRDTVTSHLRLFSQLAGGAVHHEDAVAHFGLRGIARAKLRDLPASQAALVRLARASLLQPEVCLIERPLSDLDAEGRASALAWMSEAEERGCRFITTLQPLREALLMPGVALWCEDGRFIEVARDEDDSAAPPDGAFDEVRVCKIPAKADAATLLFDPREIDFIESANKQNHVSVRGSLYPTPLTMDELDDELSRFGFFRCHRSYIVNAQRVAKVERYTRNSFNLTLNDANRTSLPLSKGRAQELHERLGLTREVRAAHTTSEAREVHAASTAQDGQADSAARGGAEGTAAAQAAPEGASAPTSRPDRARAASPTGEEGPKARTARDDRGREARGGRKGRAGEARPTRRAARTEGGPR